MEAFNNDGFKYLIPFCLCFSVVRHFWCVWIAVRLQVGGWAELKPPAVTKYAAKNTLLDMALLFLYFIKYAFTFFFPIRFKFMALLQSRTQEVDEPHKPQTSHTTVLDVFSWLDGRLQPAPGFTCYSKTFTSYGKTDEISFLVKEDCFWSAAKQIDHNRGAVEHFGKSAFFLGAGCEAAHRVHA